jgi:hypothetical protein
MLPGASAPRTRPLQPPAAAVPRAAPPPARAAGADGAARGVQGMGACFLAGTAASVISVPAPPPPPFPPLAVPLTPEHSDMQVLLTYKIRDDKAQPSLVRCLPTPTPQRTAPRALTR